MRRTSWYRIGPLLSLAVVASCRDGVVSPVASTFRAPSAAEPASIAFAPQGRPSLNLSGDAPDSTAVDFVVGPTGGVFYAGNHAVVFPAQSICDPATSSYGPDTWDATCNPLQSTLKVHAEVRRTKDRTWVDFTPSLRFVPSTNSARWVWMVMYTPDAKGTGGDLSNFNILWTSSLGAPGIDETATDPTLRTYVDTFSGISLRRIKHFSGYMVGSGRSESEPPPE